MTEKRQRADERQRADGGPGMVALLADRARLTEGQLYSAVFVVLVILLLSLTGLPTAERRPGSQPVAPPPAAPLVTEAPTTTAVPAP